MEVTVCGLPFELLRRVEPAADHVSSIQGKEGNEPWERTRFASIWMASAIKHLQFYAKLAPRWLFQRRDDLEVKWNQMHQSSRSRLLQPMASFRAI